jgi:hypothetical protein
MNNGLDALRAIDAHQIVVDNSFPVETLELFSGTGKQLSAIPIGAGTGVLGPQALKRGTLYRVLHDEVARRGIRIEHAKRLPWHRTPVSSSVTPRTSMRPTPETARR